MTNDYAQAAQSLAALALGPKVTLKLRDEGERSLAWIADPTTSRVLALAASPDRTGACLGLLRQLTSAHGQPITLDSSDVAAVLGVSVRRLNRFVETGRLVPVEPGSRPRGHRFSPNDVFRFLQLPRSPGGWHPRRAQAV